ncbi:putative F-box domain-containing protein [Rosa chinensis]|uniref:Putative F-box domain-containing protein n=1 Tax=Rosa chinensis TaxID=74649 RepID=A0A2P6QCP3_ROSCH|nr:F-box protein At5g07610 [Rosa chinensis]PRQ31950.1 putative F-box domain-containing protein [Rosa chinensis]
MNSSSAETVANIEELLQQILVRLPALSVLRFKCVSKHWLSLISTPQFCHLHTLQNPNPKISGFFASSTYCSTFIPLQNQSGTTNPFNALNDFVHADDPDTLGLDILQSCNGLFLCRHRVVPFLCHHRVADLRKRHPVYVVNPTTNQFSVLSSPRVGKDPFFIRYALAFDPSKSPHYKVVCLDDHQIDIYSSETRAWKLLETSFKTEDWGSSREGGVYCNGAVHWIRDHTQLVDRWVRDDSDVLHYYVIGEDSLRLAVSSPPLVVTAPYSDCFSRIPDHRYFGESGSHLCLIDIYWGRNSNTQFYVKEMRRDYSGWFVKYHVDLNPLISFSRRFWFLLLGVVENDEEDQHHQNEEEGSSSLLLHIPGKVIPYSLRNKSYKISVDLPKEDQHYFIPKEHCHGYVESLACV